MNKILKWIKIDKIWYGWVGLARRQDGKRILIKGWALPKSIVDLRIVKERKDYCEAHIISIQKTDPSIVDGKVFCPHFFSLLQGSEQDINKAKVGCWGCKWQMLSYKNQMKLKEDIVLEAFEKIRKLDPNIQFLPIIGSPQEKNYRNKIEFSFGKYITQNDWTTEIDRTKNREPRPLIVLSDRSLGFHKQGEFSKIIDIDSCWLISDQANALFEYIKNICHQSGLPVYDQKTHQWFFRHLVIREWTNTGQFLINLSVADHNLKEDENTKREHLLEAFKKDTFLTTKITTFVITYNNELGDTIKNNKSETKIFRWEGHIYEALNFEGEEGKHVEVTFRVSPFSFFQTNTLWAQQLFSEAFKLIGNIEGTILDLYCGTGSIGLSLLKTGQGNKLVGIEIVDEAITDARYNAKINGLEEQVTFLTAPAEKAFTSNPELKEKIKNLWLVIIDPPRDGLHKNTVTLIADLKKEYNFKLLYISCNPITMKRDIELLLEQWFTLKIIQPMDMFPQTHHIETIGVLE